MIKQFKVVLIILLHILVLHSSPALSLEQLSGTEMKGIVAQSGIDIALSQVIVYNAADSVQFLNPDENKKLVDGTDDPTSYKSYLEVGDYSSLITISSGYTDVDGDGDYGTISIDIGTINSDPYFILKADDFEMKSNTTIGSINYCGTDIGSLNIVDAEMSNFHLYMGAHGSGIDAEIGFATRTELFEFQYNDAPTSPDTGILAISGVAFAGSFTGDENDPSTWEPDGEFQLGDIENGKPVVIDIAAGGDSEPNPGPHIFIQAGSVEGSFRVENINFGGNDVGQIIMDGINLTKFDVELPGRGLGRP